MVVSQSKSPDKVVQAALSADVGKSPSSSTSPTKDLTTKETTKEEENKETPQREEESWIKEEEKDGMGKELNERSLPKKRELPATVLKETAPPLKKISVDIGGKTISIDLGNEEKKRETKPETPRLKDTTPPLKKISVDIGGKTFSIDLGGEEKKPEKKPETPVCCLCQRPNDRGRIHYDGKGALGSSSRTSSLLDSKARPGSSGASTGGLLKKVIPSTATSSSKPCSSTSLPKKRPVSQLVRGGVAPGSGVSSLLRGSSATLRPASKFEFPVPTNTEGFVCILGCVMHKECAALAREKKLLLNIDRINVGSKAASESPLFSTKVLKKNIAVLDGLLDAIDFNNDVFALDFLAKLTGPSPTSVPGATKPSSIPVSVFKQAFMQGPGRLGEEALGPMELSQIISLFGKANDKNIIAQDSSLKKRTGGAIQPSTMAGKADKDQEMKEDQSNEAKMVIEKDTVKTTQQEQTKDITVKSESMHDGDVPSQETGSTGIEKEEDKTTKTATCSTQPETVVKTETTDKLDNTIKGNAAQDSNSKTALSYRRFTRESFGYCNDNWKAQRIELGKLPECLRFTSSVNVLHFFRPQSMSVCPRFSIKEAGVCTPICEGTNRFRTFTINHGPGEEEWGAIPASYGAALKHLIGQDFGRAVPNVGELICNGIPVMHGISRPKELLGIGPGTLYWTVTKGQTVSSAWNFLERAVSSFRAAFESHPMLSLSLDLANAELAANKKGLATLSNPLLSLLSSHLDKALVKEEHIRKLVRETHFRPTVEPHGSCVEHCEDCGREIFHTYFYCATCDSYGPEKVFTPSAPFSSTPTTSVTSSASITSSVGSTAPTTAAASSSSSSSSCGTLSTTTTSSSSSSTATSTNTSSSHSGYLQKRPVGSFTGASSSGGVPPSHARPSQGPVQFSGRACAPGTAPFVRKPLAIKPTLSSTTTGKRPDTAASTTAPSTVSNVATSNAPNSASIGSSGPSSFLKVKPKPVLSSSHSLHPGVDASSRAGLSVASKNTNVTSTSTATSGYKYGASSLHNKAPVQRPLACSTGVGGTGFSSTQPKEKKPPARRKPRSPVPSWLRLDSRVVVNDSAQMGVVVKSGHGFYTVQLDGSSKTVLKRRNGLSSPEAPRNNVLLIASEQMGEMAISSPSAIVSLRQQRTTCYGLPPASMPYSMCSAPHRGVMNKAVNGMGAAPSNIGAAYGGKNCCSDGCEDRLVQPKLIRVLRVRPAVMCEFCWKKHRAHFSGHLTLCFEKMAFETLEQLIREVSQLVRSRSTSLDSLTIKPPTTIEEMISNVHKMTEYGLNILPVYRNPLFHQYTITNPITLLMEPILSGSVDASVGNAVVQLEKQKSTASKPVGLLSLTSSTAVNAGPPRVGLPTPGTTCPIPPCSSTTVRPSTLPSSGPAVGGLQNAAKPPYSVYGKSVGGVRGASAMSIQRSASMPGSYAGNQAAAKQRGSSFSTGCSGTGTQRANNSTSSRGEPSWRSKSSSNKSVEPKSLGNAVKTEASSYAASLLSKKKKGHPLVTNRQVPGRSQSTPERKRARLSPGCGSPIRPLNGAPLNSNSLISPNGHVGGVELDQCSIPDSPGWNDLFMEDKNNYSLFDLEDRQSVSSLTSAAGSNEDAMALLASSPGKLEVDELLSTGRSYVDGVDDFALGSTEFGLAPTDLSCVDPLMSISTSDPPVTLANTDIEWFSDIS